MTGIGRLLPILTSTPGPGHSTVHKGLRGSLFGALSIWLASCALGSNGSSVGGAPVTRQEVTDSSLALRASLVPSDLPAGWTSVPGSGGPAAAVNPAFDRQLENCLHSDIAVLNEDAPGQYWSPQFDDSNGDKASSYTEYEAAAGPIDESFAVLRKAQAQQCIQLTENDLLLSSAESSSIEGSPTGVSMGNATAAAMSFPNYGERTAAWQIAVPLSLSSVGVISSIYLDLVIVQKGRAAVTLMFLGTGSPLSSGLEEHLTEVTVNRLADTRSS